MIKVSSREEAWRLADRLFPSDYEQEPFDKEIGYAIYRSTNSGMNAWISDLGSRLELNYPNGNSENIWIDEGADIVAFVGMYKEEPVFGNLVIRNVREIPYHHVKGIIHKTLDDGQLRIEITFENDNTASFGCENVAYIRFSDKE